MTPTPPFRTRASGVSLLEVLIMAVILGICAMALGQAMMGSMHQTRMADEMRAASFAARKQLEDMLGKDINVIESLHGTTFPVQLSSAPVLMLPGPGDVDAGEIIVFNNEEQKASKVGRDLDGVNGPDGVTLAPWPIDLNSDGVVDKNLKTNRIVVGVVVRWITFAGLEQRYELWSVR